MKTIVWSTLHTPIFENIARGSGHLMVDAVAGSGKTTTLLEAMRYVPEGKSCLFLAFNKDIADELKSRVPEGVTASTFHSLGFQIYRNVFGRKIRVDKFKCHEIAADLTGSRDEPRLKEWTASIVKAVGLCKNYLASSTEDVEHVLNLHSVVPPETEEERPKFIRQVQEVLTKCREITDRIDFDDMVWLPVVLKLSGTRYDIVFVDEVQDLNEVQIALLEKILKKGGRICAVGDPRQAIYQFRGAAAGAFDKIRDRFNATIYPLSVTHRCAKQIVTEAQRFVPYLEAAPDAEEGHVTPCEEDRMMKECREGDFILSRSNAPLTRICLALLAEGRRAHMQGRTVGTKLQSVVRRAKGKTVDEMLEKVGRWGKTEIARLEKKGEDTSGIADILECIAAIAEGVTSVQVVLDKIEMLFADGNSTTRITLSSTHKAKGMERDRVWLLRNTYLRVRKGQTETTREEQNLYYVACTRARHELFLVNNQDGRKK